MQGATTMPNTEIPVPSAEMQRRLEIADAQSILYTRDRERNVDAECQKVSKLTAAKQQLQAHARNLKTVFNAARSTIRELEQVYHNMLPNRRPTSPPSITPGPAT
jgi:hypothetical protein